MGSRLAVSARWRTAAARATGSSHAARDEPCQDAVATRALIDGRTVIAVADGAGSAPFAAEGSTSAVAVAVEAIALGATIEEAFELAAWSLGPRPRERATTLLVAVLDGGTLEAGQVGDGYIVVRRKDGYEVALAGPAREYLNETTFLSSTNWRDEFRHGVIDGIAGVAVLTDGLQLVAFDLASETPFPGFFDPLFAWLAGDPPDHTALDTFLASPRLAERTDDDLTIALAVTRTES